jgi:hypothetical protein
MSDANTIARINPFTVADCDCNPFACDPNDDSRALGHAIARAATHAIADAAAVTLADGGCDCHAHACGAASPR